MIVDHQVVMTPTPAPWSFLTHDCLVHASVTSACNVAAVASSKIMRALTMAKPLSELRTTRAFRAGPRVG